MRRRIIWHGFLALHFSINAAARQKRATTNFIIRAGCGGDFFGKRIQAFRPSNSRPEFILRFQLDVLEISGVHLAGDDFGMDGLGMLQGVGDMDDTGEQSSRVPQRRG